MNAKYGDMLAAIQKHDKGLYRYSRYSGESVAILTAAIRNKARGDFNLLGAAQHYMGQNFIDFDAPKSEAQVNPVDTTTQQEQPKKALKKPVATDIELTQVRSIIKHCHKVLNISFKKIAEGAGVGEWSVYKQSSAVSPRIMFKETAQKIIQFGQSLGITQ